MTNQLAGETSPYLLQHAENPVEWLPWGEAALGRARREDKPIFLSIGYAACHWCHVMAHESFEDPATADLLNREFIPVKVDREERPDVDSLYMEAVVALTGQGGWPLSVFLTPEGEPFYGGTYFPPSPRHGLPSFAEVLAAVATAWRGDRARLTETARRLSQHVGRGVPLSGVEAAVDIGTETRAMEGLLRQYDWQHGGWGGAPKFPSASVVGLLLRRHQREGDRMALDMASHCLGAMAAGGIFDQLGGGFHRYAVDQTWTVPHFEKMLYDNALLARVYLEAWQVTGELFFRQTAIDTLDFLRRELRTPEGGFSASLDADSEGEEGRFYVWTESEIEAGLPDPGELDAFRTAFDIRPQGNFEGRLVLRRSSGDHGRFPAPHEREAAARARLLALRAARVRPALDDKVITAWNGLALSAWAAAARALQRPQDLATAQALAGFLLDRLLVDGRLHRTFRLGVARQPAFLDDHAGLAEGLLDLYQVDFDRRWLDAAIDLGETILRDFGDPQGGFFDSPAQQTGLLARPKSLQDTPLPSGNAMAANLFLRLEALTGATRFREAAMKPVAAIQETAARHPTAFAAWLQVVGQAASPIPQLAIIGERQSEGFRRLAEEAHRRFLPRLVMAGGEAAGAGDLALLEGKSMLGDEPTAYLCHGFVCRQPVKTPEELGAQLAEAT